MKRLYAWLCFWQKCNSSKYKALKLAKPTHTNKDDQVMHTENDFNFSLHCLCKNKANSPRVVKHISCNIYTAIITHLNMGQMWYKLVETSFHGYSEGICWTSQHYKNQKHRVTLFFHCHHFCWSYQQKCCCMNIKILEFHPPEHLFPPHWTFVYLYTMDDILHFFPLC